MLRTKSQRQDSVTLQLASANQKSFCALTESKIKGTATRLARILHSQPTRAGIISKISKPIYIE